MTAPEAVRRRRLRLAANGALVVVGGVVLVLLVFPRGHVVPSAEVDVVIRTPSETAAQSERTVAVPLERVLGRAHGVAGIVTRSSAGEVLATCTGAEGVDGRELFTEVTRVLAAWRPPAGSDVRALGPTFVEAHPVRRIVVGSPSLARADRQALVSRVRAAIERIDGAGNVSVCGDAPHVARVVLDPDAMAARGVTFDDVCRAIRGREPAATLELLAARVVRPGDGSTLRLRDVAQVIDDFGEAPCRAWHRGSEDVTVIDVPGVGIVGRWHPERLGSEVDAVLARSGARRSAARALPAPWDATSGLIMAAASSSEETARMLVALGDQLSASADVREVLIEAPRAGERIEHAPVGAARLTVIGTMSGTRIGAIAAATPGIVFVPDRTDRRALVRGPDLDADRDVAERACSLLRATPGIRGAVVLDAGRVPHVAVTPDRARLGELGLAPAAVDDTVRLATDGLRIEPGLVASRTAPAPRDLMDIVAELPRARRADPRTLADAPLWLAGGQRVPLSQVASIRVETADAEIVRVDRERTIEVAIWGDRPAIDRGTANVLRELRVPAGVRIELHVP